MNLLDKKLQEKLLFLEEYDINNNILSDTSNNEISPKNNSTLEEKKNNKYNKFENRYCNFEFGQKDKNVHFNNLSDIMEYMHSNNQKNNIKINTDERLTHNSKDNKDLYNNKNNNNFTNNKINKTNQSTNSNKNRKKKKISLNKLPKSDNIIDRLLRYGENVQKKKEMLREQNELMFINMANFSCISQNNKNNSLNPDIITERLYNNKYKDDKKENSVNNNLTFRPSINKKSQKIANKLEPSSSRLLIKKKALDINDIQKLTINSYKNLFLKNCYNIRNSKKKNNININKLINRLYNDGLTNIKKKELKYQENLIKKSEDYKKYSFYPHKIQKNHKSTSIEQISKNLYKKPFEMKSQRVLENSKKKELKENSYLNGCTFKPSISYEIKKDEEKFIRQYMKNSNNYIERQKKKINEDKERESKSYNSRKNYGFSLKDLYYEPMFYVINGKEVEIDCPYINFKRGNNTKRTYRTYKNNMDCVIPPNTKRIFCYYNESGDYNNSIICNNFSNEDYSKFDFIEAINALHNEIDNLNI